MRTTFWLGAAAVLATTNCGSSVVKNPSTQDVTLNVSTTSSGDTTFSLPVKIGNGDAIDTVFDTGSSGLRVLANVIPESALDQITDQQVTYSFHNGIELRGVVAYARVTIGTMTTPEAIPIMLIQNVGCTSTDPNCAAAGKSIDDYKEVGPAAILGVGMRSKPSDGGIGSPIPQFHDHPSFLVHLVDRGATQATLTIGVSKETKAEFKRYQLESLSGGAALQDGTPAYNDRGIPSCVTDRTNNVSYCVPAELDSGNSDAYIEWPAHTDSTPTIIAAGTDLDVAIGPPESPLYEYELTVGSTPQPGIDLVKIESAPSAPATPYMNLGTSIFFRYDVLFDSYLGVEGLR
jgi:hypothetical protein